MLVMPHRRLFAALCAVGLLAVALPATSSASTRSKTKPLAANGGSATLTVHCPSGQLATGGGFRTAPSGTTFAAVWQSRKWGQRAWRVSATEFSGTPSSVRAYVYCASGAPQTDNRSSGLTSAVANAACQGSQSAQAGGFLLRRGSSGFLDSFRVGGDSWRVRDVNNESIHDYAYCAGGPEPGVKKKTKSSMASGVALTVDSRKCAGQALSGGLAQPDSGSFFMTYFVTESRRVGHGQRWRTTGTFFSMGPPPAPVRLTSLAYCQPGGGSDDE
ncbi:MAG: hypothetical protein QOG26_136 [Solirubrobacterales bacterium]|nr:hypothetical protein [Solirubrobacterales bacterium]